MEISAKNARVRPCIEIQIRNIEANCWFVTQMYMFLLTIRQQRTHKKWTYWKNKLTPNRLKIQKMSSYKHSSPKCVRASWHYYRKKIQIYMYTLGTLPSSSHYFNHGTSLGGTTIERLSREFSGLGLKSHWGQLFIATSKNLSVVNTICISSFRYTQVIPQRKFDWNKYGDWWRQWLK